MVAQIKRYEPTATDNLIYTKKAAAMVLEIDIKEIETLVPTKTGCWVYYGENSHSFVKRCEFGEIFVNDRKARSQTITVTQNCEDERLFTARNQDNDNTYQVNLTRNGVHCKCPDYERQLEAGLSRKMCKHGYAVLSKLGLHSLKEYLEVAR